MTTMESHYDEYTVRGQLFRYKGFDKIDSPEKAYFIGYMCADGSYIQGKKGDNTYPRLGLTSVDFYVVEHFRGVYCPDVKINYREPRSSKKVKANNKVAEIVFPRALSSTFKRFGIFDYKPNRRMVGIPKKFYNSFFLGVMDADGCFVIRHRKDCRTPRLNVHIVSEALKLLEDLQRILDQELGVSSSIYQRSASKCSELRVNNVEHAVKLGKWLYHNPPAVYNFKKRRVFNKYLDLL